VDRFGFNWVGVERGGGSLGYPRLPLVTSGYLLLPVVTFAVKLESSVGEGGVLQLGTFWVKGSPLGSLWDFWCQVGTFGKLYLIGWVKRGVSLLGGWMV